MKKNNAIKKVITGVIVGVLVLGSAGLAVGLVLRDKNNKTKKTPADTTVVVEADKDTFYLLGDKTNWAWSDNYAFSVDKENSGVGNVETQYTYTGFFEVGDEVKIWKGSDDWNYNHFEQDFDFGTRGDNFKFTKTGVYTFYLKMYDDGGDSVWVNKSGSSLNGYDLLDCQNIYLDYLPYSGSVINCYSKTTIEGYDRIVVGLRSVGYSGTYYTPRFVVENPYKTGDDVVFSDKINSKLTNLGDEISQEFTLTLSANEENHGINVSLQVGNSFTVTLWTSETNPLWPLGLTFK